MYPANEKAWLVWQVCNRIGREGFSGNLQAANVLSVIEAHGGDEEDLEKVMIIEEIASKARKIEHQEEE